MVMVVDEIIKYQIIYFVHVCKFLYYTTLQYISDLDNLIITTMSGTNQRMSYLIKY